MNKELVINYEDPKMISTLKETVAKGVTDAEFMWFIQVCRESGLNPLKREIWCIPGKRYQNKDGQWVQGAVQIMTGINGYLTIAQNHPQFDGMETKIEVDENDKPISSTTTVYRKDRKLPTVATVWFKEFYKPGNTYNGKYTEGTWDKMPKVLIQKVSKAHALREAFGSKLLNLYIEEELPEPKEIDTSPFGNNPQLPDVKVETEAVIQEPTVYDITPLFERNDGTGEKAAEYLTAKGAKFDPDRSIWTAPQKIKKLAAYEVGQ